MNVSAVFRYTGLLIVGLMAGSSLTFVIGMGPVIETLSVNSYMELHQSLDANFTAWWAPILYYFLTVMLVGNLITIRRQWRSLEFMLILGALICILDELLMTLSGNLPLNRMIHSWQTLSPPPNWMEVRSQWMRFMYIRCALLVTGFGLLLASSFFMTKIPVSRQDVFAAV